MSETAKYRHLTARYLWGCGIDIGCGADPVTPWANQLGLNPEIDALTNTCAGDYSILFVAKKLPA